MSTGNHKKKSNYIVQGGILAAASILVRIIGMVYRIPVTRILGPVGNSYYSAAYEVYSMVLLISSFSLPLAVSKLVSARMAAGQVKAAYKIFKCTLLFALVSGGIGALLIFFGAGFFSDVLVNTPESRLALQVLAPTILVVAIMGCLRGYFQGLGTMVPTAVSQIIEQIINAVVSIVGASVLFGMGSRAGEKAGEELLGPAYGAAGGTLGTVIGAAAGLLFLLFVLWIFKGGIRRQIQRDHTKGKESYSHILKILVMTAIPVIFSTAIYNINQILDLTVFNHIMDAQGFTESEYMALQGIYTGKYDPLINVPMSIPYALSTSIVPALTTVVMARNRKKTHYQIDQTLRLTTIITLPSCVGFLVLASPLMVLLYNDAGKVPAQLLMLGSVVIILYGWSTITNAVLQGLNYLSSPAKNAAAALVVHLGALVLMLTVFKLNVYALVGSNIVFAVIMCVLNQRKIRQVCGFRINIRRTFVKPLIASAIMGVITYAVHFGLHRLIGGRVIPTVLAIIVAVIVYGVLILKLGALSEKDIQALPMGTRILRGCQALKLMPPSEE